MCIGFGILMEEHLMHSFFNDGTLDGDEITQQIYHVISCCEVVGLTVLGICCDAGGSNRSFLSQFMSKELCPESNKQGWLKKKPFPYLIQFMRINIYLFFSVLSMV